MTAPQIQTSVDHSGRQRCLSALERGPATSSPRSESLQLTEAAREPYLSARLDLCTGTPYGSGWGGHDAVRTSLLNLMTQTSSVLANDPRPAEQAQGSSASSGTRSKISVLVVAAERLFGLGVARLLGEDENLDVIGVSDGDADLPGLCRTGPVDVALVDLELSRVDAIDLVRRISVECLSTKSLVLTSNPDWRVRSAMIAGAGGVLLKDTSPEATRAAVVSVHLGDQVFCSEAAQWVMGNHRSVRLTRRESDVLRVLAQGADNAEIARQLQLGQKTVRNYISRLYRKLDVDSRAQLARYLSRSDAGAHGDAD